VKEARRKGKVSGPWSSPSIIEYGIRKGWVREIYRAWEKKENYLREVRNLFISLEIEIFGLSIRERPSVSYAKREQDCGDVEKLIHLKNKLSSS